MSNNPYDPPQNVVPITTYSIKVTHLFPWVPCLLVLLVGYSLFPLWLLIIDKVARDLSQLIQSFIMILIASSLTAFFGGLLAPVRVLWKVIIALIAASIPSAVFLAFILYTAYRV